MADFYAIQTALGVAASTITGLRGYPTLPDAINPPVFAPIDSDIDYDESFGGLVQVVVSCHLFTSRGDTEAGRKLLLGYLPPTGATSIKAAIEADRMLGGVTRTLRVERARGVGNLYTVGGVEYLGARFEIRVWAI